MAAVVERAAALTAGDRERVLTTAVASEPACRYQWARSLFLAGGAERERGRAELAAVGTPVPR